MSPALWIGETWLRHEGLKGSADDSADIAGRNTPQGASLE